METVLYFQSPSKNSASDKVRGVRRYAAIANWHIQVLDEFPSSKSVLELYEFWNPVGSIIECGGGNQDIDTGIFTKIPAVYLDRNPLTLPPDVSCISHDSVATGRTMPTGGSAQNMRDTCLRHCRAGRWIWVSSAVGPESPQPQKPTEGKPSLERTEPSPRHAEP